MNMSKWLLAALLVLQAHFAARTSSLLDREARETFGGLLRWAWSGGDSGPLGQVTASSGFPFSGFFLAVGAAGLFLLAALAVVGIRVPLGWWRVLATGGADFSLLLMAAFFGTTLLTDDMKSARQAARVRLRVGSGGAIGSPLGFYPL
jgi:hypothetical protein